jgi:hypothetical protein
MLRLAQADLARLKEHIQCHLRGFIEYASAA